MQKKVENLSVHDYNEVDDMIYELLYERYGIERYDFESLEKEVEYVVGTINIVKLGDTSRSLKHKQSIDGEWHWSDDVPVTESYEYATYYVLDKFTDLCQNTLTGSWSETYNFREMLNRDR